jgi:fibronectin-binding autotransporter adhesin
MNRHSSRRSGSVGLTAAHAASVTLLGLACMYPSASAQQFILNANSSLSTSYPLTDGFTIQQGATLTINPGGSFTAANNSSSFVGGTTTTGFLNLKGGAATAYDLSVGNGGSSISAIFAGGAGTIGGPESVLTANNNFYVGNTSQAYLQLFANSSVVSKNTYIGHGNGVEGLVQLFDGASWTNSGILNVGESGVGVIEITKGSSLTTTGSSIANLGQNDFGRAFIEVDGAGTSWTSDSFFLKNGFITISGGAELTSRDTRFGDYDGTGSITVTGSGSTWNSTVDADVGQFGTGNVTINDGATWNSNFVYVGRNGSTGNVTVTGPSTTWTSTNAVRAGFTGPGFLTISDGATVNTDGAGVGFFSDSPGTVLVTGAGTSWTTSYLEIRSVGSSLTVSNGAALTTTGNARITSSEDQHATVTVTGAGSAWAANTLIVGNGGTGILTVSNGGKVSADSLSLGQITDSGTLNIGAAASAAAAASGVIDAATISGATGTGTATLQFNTTGTTYFTRDGTATGTGVNTTGNIALVSTAGTNVVTGSFAHTGGTTINGGTLQIGTGGTGGSISGDITNNATLRFNRSDALAFDGIISGTGSLTKQGAGTLTLSGANSYGGGTTISNGTLQIGAGGTTGLITGNITNNSALVFDRSNDFAFGDVISGDGIVTKQGAGVLTLGGTNTYSGHTTISAGTLSLGTTGSLTDSAGIAIATGATFDVSGLAGGFTLGASQTLSGNGIILGNVTTAGTLSPGNSTGELQFTGDLLLDSAAIIEMEIASLTDFDRVIVDSMLTYGGTLTLSFLGGFQPAIGDTFELFQGFSSHGGTFDDIAFPTSDYAANVNYGTGQLTFTAVPEPNTFVFLAISALATAFFGRQRRLSR